MPGRLRPSIDVVCRSAHDLRRLAEVISGLADLEAHARLTKGPGDLGALVEGCVARMRPAAETRRIAIVLDVPTPVTGTFDGVEVGRAVDALLENAVHYAPDGSTVTVAVCLDGGWARVEVRDEGCGIAPGDRARLVQPFERGNHERQPVNSRGLGLSVAHTVAAAHGGELWLDDHEPQGLLASLVLPQHGVTPWAPDEVSGRAGRQAR